jgi:hypothetical protein
MSHRVPPIAVAVLLLVADPTAGARATQPQEQLPVETEVSTTGKAGERPAVAAQPQGVPAEDSILLILPAPASAEEGFGRCVAAVTDVDGDGYVDVAVGGSQAQLVSGKDGSLLRTFPDPRSIGTGYSLTPIGDLDRDGHIELAIHAGGIPTSSLFVASSASGNVRFSLTTSEEMDFFGHTVAGVGDLDGDGIGDIVTAARRARERNVLIFFEARAPAFVRAYSGRSGAILWTVESEDESVLYADVVAPLGDVDGDGVIDVGVGEKPGFYLTDTPSPSGRVHVLSGVDGSPIGRIESTLAGDPFATALVPLGDVDRDGGPDLAIGSDQHFGALEGYVRVVSLRDGRTLYTVHGKALNDKFGTSLAVVGDWNGDGIGDLAVGAPHLSTSTDGPRSGYVTVLSGNDGSLLATIAGPDGEWQFGAAVAAVGDVNGDGHPDLLVGAPGLRSCVYLLSGAKLMAAPEGSALSR